MVITYASYLQVVFQQFYFAGIVQLVRWSTLFDNLYCSNRVEADIPPPVYTLVPGFTGISWAVSVNFPKNTKTTYWHQINNLLYAVGV